MKRRSSTAYGPRRRAINSMKQDPIVRFAQRHDTVLPVAMHANRSAHGVAFLEGFTPRMNSMIELIGFEDGLRLEVHFL